MNKLKTFITNTIILLISSITFQLILLFFNTYISNTIGKEAVGVFSLVLSVYLFGITLASSGINITATKLISEQLACNNEKIAKQIAKKCIIISLICGIITSIFFLIFSDFIINKCLHNKISIKVIYAICIALPFISMSSAINGYFTAVRRVIKNALSKFFEEASKVIITILILNIVLPKKIDSICLCLVIGDVISEIISFISLYFFYYYDKKKLNSNYRFIESESITKKIIKTNSPIAITSYIRSGITTLKQFLIPISLEKSGIHYSIAISHYGLIGRNSHAYYTFSQCINK